MACWESFVPVGLLVWVCGESFVPVGLLVWVCWESFVPEILLRLLMMSVCLCLHCPCGRLSSGGEKFRMQFP